MAAIVGEVMSDGDVESIGLGVAESQGIRRGAVVNQEAAVDSIRKAVEAAELTAGIEIDNAYVSLSGTHIKGFNSRGVVAVAGRNREITREDVRRAIDAARAVSLPGGREILHVLPQDFVVDDEDGIGNPIGMTGARLEDNVHIITGGTTTTQNIVTCVNKAGVNVQESVLEQLAASEAVLTADEKELGVAVIDIGGGTTDLAIFERGFLWHTAVVPIGGDHFTSDIAVGLRMPIPEAEKLKRRCGCALSSMVAALTHGKKGYENAFAEMERVGLRAQELIAAFVEDVDRDTDAFNRVMDAMRLPKTTEEDRRARQAAIEEATKGATLVPLGVLRRCCEAASLAGAVVRHGNRNSVSDGGVASSAARTAAEGAFLNVKINLPGISDAAFKSATLDEARALRDETVRAAEEAMRLCEEIMDAAK